MKSLTELQRLILALLDEAGEEELATLINTLRKRPGLVEELDSFMDGLVGLIEYDLVRIARRRDEISKRLVPSSRTESVAAVGSIKELFRWSNADQLWKWSTNEPRLEAVVTDEGEVAARNILAKDGWPTDLA